MTEYKDIEKRKVYQKLWAREKTIKKKAMISDPVIVESVVESMNPEAIFCIQYYKLIELRKQYDLTDYAYWTMRIREVNKEILEMNVQEVLMIDSIVSKPNHRRVYIYILM
jgi:hypothetical protein